MKTLTITQPWATLVAIGAKQIETRSWATAYRGPLAIHAAKGYPKDAARLCITEPFTSVLQAAGLIQYGVWHKSNNQLPLGAIVATCEIVNCIKVPAESSYFSRTDREKGRVIPFYQDVILLPPNAPEFLFGDYTPGRYAWIFGDVKPLETPILAKGALGLWEWEGSLSLP